MAIDWSDAPEFGRKNTLMHAMESLHLLRDRHDEDVVIVETGTTRGSLGGGVVGDGWATLLFGWYCKKYGGKVYTIDILPDAIKECKEITKDYEEVIEYIVGDSVSYLNSFKGRIDFLYLDSADDPEIILNELLVASTKVKEEALVVIDDTHENMSRGKGVLACSHLLTHGWRLLLDLEGQVIFTNAGVIINRTSFMPSDFSATLYEFVQYAAEGSEVKLKIEDYDEQAILWQKVFFSWLPAGDIPKVDGVGKVLDLGCHSGYNTKQLEDIYGYAVGVDINEELIRFSKLNHDKCYVMSAEELCFDDESFAVVVAKDVIEHTLNPYSVIEEAYRVLIDAGYFVCMVPLDGELFGIDDITLHPVFNTANASHMWKATLNGVLSRIFSVGFTEVELGIVKHSELFGRESRIYGDRVCIIRARKRKDIIKVPIKWLLEDMFWGAFVTLSCTGNCFYCIQHLSRNEFVEARSFYNRNQLTSQQWIEFYSRAQRFKGHTLSITGGEPLLYDGLFELINSLDGYYKTVTTNLCAPAFEKLETEVSQEAKRSLRINTSFHPSIANVEDFCEKVHKLRNLGYNVDQVAMVDYPLSNYKHYYKQFLGRGITLAPQTYLGLIDGVLVPNEDSEAEHDYREHCIDNFDAYTEGFSCKEKREVLCMSRRFMVSPNGNIYRCHYHLYSNRSPLGNIAEGTLPEPKDYEECNDYGFCNPCDYSQVRFKSPIIQVPQIVLNIVRSEEVAKAIMSLVPFFGKDFEKLIIDIALELYMASDVYWELYNNKKVRSLINDFINVGGFDDNSNALALANLEVNLFRCLPFGINVYRILERKALMKYVDSLSDIVLKTIGSSEELVERFYIPELHKALDSDVASIVVSLGMASFDTPRIQVARGDK